MEFLHVMSGYHGFFNHFGQINSSEKLGPLHSWAKSRDHEIVRAQKKVFKGRPNPPPNPCSVVTDAQV